MRKLELWPTFQMNMVFTVVFLRVSPYFEGGSY
jgi:hypothetical protein